LLKSLSIDQIKVLLSHDRRKLKNRKEAVRRMDAQLLELWKDYMPTHGLPVNKADKPTAVLDIKQKKDICIGEVLHTRKILYQDFNWEEEFNWLRAAVDGRGGQAIELDTILLY
jgi:hypothetical protein